MYSFQSRYFALLVGASVLAILPYSAMASEISLSDTQVQQLIGEAAGDLTGSAVASAGDVNNDGYDDILVGASGANGVGIYSGAGYLIYGDSTEFSDITLSTSAVVKFTGEGADTLAGNSIASAGDVNNDGYDDILIGSAGSNDYVYNTGAAYLIYGQSTALSDLTLSADTAVKFTGEADGDRAGVSVASVGDVNGDGYDDILIGADSNDAGGIDAGAVYLIYGQSANLDDFTLDINNAVTFTGEADGDLAGSSVASAGDVNNDGYDDILVGAYNNSGDNTGATYLIYGQSTTFSDLELNVSTGVKFTGEAAGDFAGTAVASAGDVNNDGYDDLLIGAIYNTVGSVQAGAAYLIYGQSADLSDLTLSADTAVKFTGEAVYDVAGYAVSSAGDVNNDGYDDILIGSAANSAAGSSTGAVYLIYGQSTALADLTLSATTTIKFTGEAAGDNAGYSVASAGDVNGDGYDDLLIGAINHVVDEVQSGVVYLMYQPLVELTTNGRYLRVFVNGEITDRVTVGKRKRSAESSLVASDEFFRNYTTVVFLGATKSKAKLTVVRLTAAYTFTKKASHTFAVKQNTPIKLRLKSSTHSIIATVGTGQHKVKYTYRLNAAGDLRVHE